MAKKNRHREHDGFYSAPCRLILVEGFQIEVSNCLSEQAGIERECLWLADNDFLKISVCWVDEIV